MFLPASAVLRACGVRDIGALEGMWVFGVDALGVAEFDSALCASTLCFLVDEWSVVTFLSLQETAAEVLLFDRAVWTFSAF